MDKKVFDIIWGKQVEFREDPEYQQLMEEHEIRGRQLLAQMETMNDDQRNAVLDYLGLGVEMHLKMLEFAVRWE